MLESVGFVGLGIMGKPMVENLLSAGFTVTAFDRNESKLAAVVQLGAVGTDSIGEVGRAADIVIIMVQNSPQSEAVIVGKEGLLGHLSPGNLVIDMSSIEPIVSQNIAQTLGQNGVDFLDAPVSGGQPGAEAGELVIMAGGDHASFGRAQPLFEAVGKSAVLCGPVGAGGFTKLANQMIVGANIYALAEAISFVRASGLVPETVIRAIRGGLAGSNVMETKAEPMCQRNFPPGFRLELHHKDVSNAMASAAELKLALPTTSFLQQAMTSMLRSGQGNLDHSALLLFVERLGGMDEEDR